MTKQIEEYTKDELSAKIEAIKKECKKAANALKKYEEELERREQEVPLGVPFTPTTADGDCWWLDFSGHPNHNFFNDRNFDHQVISQCGYFKSYESAKKQAEMLLAWRMALVASSKGEPIDITVLLPLMEKGRVAFCPACLSWFWTWEIPELSEECWKTTGEVSWIQGFNIKPAEDWRNSLMECGI